MVMGEETLQTEVAVIGGGPGGYAAAFRAADLGLEVTLINAEEKLGGVCLRRGCIPSKAFLEVTQLLHEARQAQQWGLSFEQLTVNPEELRDWKDKVVKRLIKGLESLAKRRDVKVVQAKAVFESPRQIRLEGADIAQIEFEHAIIATGARPIPLPGTEFKAGSRIMDSGAALKLPDVPETLLVVGGGYIGLEMGSVYAALGSRVTIVEMTGSLLPGTDPELVKTFSRQARDVFEAIHLDTQVTELEEGEEDVTVKLEGDVDNGPQQFERVLVAVGRRPNSEDIGLEQANVTTNEQGFIEVDDQLRTGSDKIFAVGDVVGEPLLAHKAMYEGKVAAGVIAGEKTAFDARCIPSIVYTDPEIAWCGLTEAEAKEQGRPVNVGRFPWKASGRALTMGASGGMTKMIFDEETNRVLGVGMVGRNAENMIIEGALAIEMGAVARDLALTVHPHPTLSETEGEAAEAFLGMSTHIFSSNQD